MTARLLQSDGRTIEMTANGSLLGTAAENYYSSGHRSTISIWRFGMILGCNYCDAKISKNFRIWLLQDIKGFTDRELFISRCNKCKQISVVLKEKRTSDNKIFINKINCEKNALRTLTRESRRVIREIVDVDFRSLNGWVYGTNVEIRNKKNQVVQIRQYSTDFNQNKHLIKKIMVNK